MSKPVYFFAGAITTTFLGVATGPQLHKSMLYKAAEDRRILKEIYQEGMEHYFNTDPLERRIKFYDTMGKYCRLPRNRSLNKVDKMVRECNK